MPKKGERKRKLAALSRDKGVRPPKVWFNKVSEKVKIQDYTLSKNRIGQIVGGIWSRMSIKSKKSIVKKYQK